MYCLSAAGSGEFRQQKRHHETGDVHEGHRKAAPLHSMCVRFRLCIDGAKNMTGDGGNVKQPHAKETKPGADLDWRELSHRTRHLAKSGEDLSYARRKTGFLPAHAIESGHVFGRILFGSEDGPKDGE